MKKHIFAIFTILWMILIFCFSAQPAEESEDMSLSVGHMIGSIFLPEYDQWTMDRQEQFAKRIDYPVRKCAHASEYAVLGILLMGAFADRKVSVKKRMIICFIIGTSYAASDEFHQLFVPGRSGQVKDILIDAFGVGFGIVLMWGMIEMRKGRENRRNSYKTS